MAAIDFPASPRVAQIYAAPGGVSWQWDGKAWVIIGGDGGGAVAGIIGHARATANQGGIGASRVDITGLTVTINADPSHQYKVTTECYLSSTVNNDVGNITIHRGGSQVQSAQAVMPASQGQVRLHCEYVASGLSGAQTFKTTAVLALGTGTLTMGAGGSYPAFILVEDLGPVTGGSLGARPTYQWRSGLNAMTPVTAWTTVQALAPTINVGFVVPANFLLPVAPAAGWYQVACNSNSDRQLSGEVGMRLLNPSGGIYLEEQWLTNGPFRRNWFVTCTAYMNAGQRVEAQMFSAAATIAGGAGDAYYSIVSLF